MTRLAQFALLGLALIIATVALHLAVAGADAPPSAGFTSASILPLKDNFVRLQLISQEDTLHTFTVELHQAGQPARGWAAIPLRPGQSWQTELQLPPGDIVVLVLRAGDTQPYRHLLLRQDLRTRVDRGVAAA